MYGLCKTMTRSLINGGKKLPDSGSHQFRFALQPTFTGQALHPTMTRNDAASMILSAITFYGGMPIIRNTEHPLASSPAIIRTQVLHRQ